MHEPELWGYLPGAVLLSPEASEGRLVACDREIHDRKNHETSRRQELSVPPWRLFLLLPPFAA